MSIVIRSEHMNLREAALQLGVEPWKLARLGRFLGLDPAEKRIPSRDVAAIASADSPEDRLALVRQWLLAQLPRSAEG